MVEIIKKGELPAEKVYTGNCGSCGCVFKFKAKEAKFHSDFRDGDYYQIECPTEGCPKLISVDKSRYDRPPNLNPTPRPKPVFRQPKDPLDGYGGHYGY